MKDYVIGFDVGGTRLKSGAVTRRGKMMVPGINPSGFALGMGNLLKTFRGEVARISEKLGGKPQAIGLGFPGAVDPEVGVVYLPGKLKGLEGFPIVKRLAKVFVKHNWLYNFMNRHITSPFIGTVCLPAFWAQFAGVPPF